MTNNQMNGQQDKFDVIIGDTTMKFQLCVDFSTKCPNWIDQIYKDRKLILNKDIDLSGTKDFFDQVINKTLNLKKENCHTIQQLAKESGYKDFEDKAIAFINENEKSLTEMANEYLQKKNNALLKEDLHHLEVSLSKHYNELLEHPQILKKFSVQQHYNILKLALEYYEKEKFDFYKFLLFCIDLFENNCDRQYSTLFSLFDPSDSDIDGYSKLLNCPSFDPTCSIFKNQNFITVIKQLKDNQEQYVDQINDLKNSINELKKQNKEIINHQDSNKNEIIDALKSYLNNEIKQSLEQIIGDIKSNNQNSTTFNSQLQNQIQSLNDSLVSQQKLNNEIKQQNKEIINQQKFNLTQIIESDKQNLASINSQFQKQIQLLNDSFNSQQKLDNEIKDQNIEIINQQKSNLTQIIDSNNKNITNIKSEFQKQNQSLNDLFNSQQKLIEEIKKQNINIIDQQKSNLTQIVESNKQNLTDVNSELQKKIQLSNESFNSSLEKINNQNTSDLKNEIQSHFKNQSKEMSDVTKIQQLTTTEITQIKDQINNIRKFIQEEQNGRSSKNLPKEEFDKIQENLKSIKEQIDYNSKIFIRKKFDEKPFSGIFAELTNKFGSNINDKGIINITGNIKGNPSYGSFSSLVNFNYDNYAYFSSEDPNSFLCFDFNDLEISVSAYTLKSTKHSEPDFIKSWVVEGSNDKTKWTKIDSHDNDTILCSPSKVHTFVIDEKNQYKDPFKFIRIKITGLSSRGKNHLEIANVEFFGKLFRTLD